MGKLWKQTSNLRILPLICFCCLGIKVAEINVAEGRKQARVLNSEAYQTEQVNQATGEANAVIAKAQAKAQAIEVVADALRQEVGKH